LKISRTCHAESKFTKKKAKIIKIVLNGALNFFYLSPYISSFIRFCFVGSFQIVWLEIRPVIPCGCAQNNDWEHLWKKKHFCFHFFFVIISLCFVLLFCCSIRVVNKIMAVRVECLSEIWQIRSWRYAYDLYPEREKNKETKFSMLEFCFLIFSYIFVWIYEKIRKQYPSIEKFCFLIFSIFFHGKYEPLLFQYFGFTVVTYKSLQGKSLLFFKALLFFS